MTKITIIFFLAIFAFFTNGCKQEKSDSKNINTQTVKQENINIQADIEQLYTHDWQGPENLTSPTHWVFNFTEPMQKILERGSSAQDALINKLDDLRIKDQIIILLGGVGDERAVEPIIKAMVSKDAIKSTSNAEKINLSANLALTNITVADVIWHHGGGVTVDKCPDNPKECWEDWWDKNKAAFTVKGITQSRNYSNYPNYGIYKEK